MDYFLYIRGLTPIEPHKNNDDETKLYPTYTTF